MSKSVYVTNSGFNEKGELYPNYIYMIEGDRKVYYDTDTSLIEPENYYIYNIIDGMTGSGIKQFGGVDKVSKSKKRSKKVVDPEPDKAVVPEPEKPKQLIKKSKKVVDPEPEKPKQSVSFKDEPEIKVIEEVKQKEEDNKNKIEDTGTKIKLLHKIFSEISILDFSGLNVTESNVLSQDYIDKFSFLKSLVFMNNTLSYIYLFCQGIIKVGSIYYSFNTKNLDNFVKFYNTAVLIDDNTSLDMYFGSKSFRNAYCINYNCYRTSTRNNIGSQRQECGACTSLRAKKAKDPDRYVKEVEGVNIQFVDTTKKINGVIYTCKEISCGDIDVVVSCDKMCFNNYNASYWGDRKKRSDGYVRFDGDTKQDNFNNTPKTAFKYKIRELTPAEKTKAAQGKAVLIRGKQSGYEDDVTLLNSKERYLCELTAPFKNYLPGVIELDHVDGNHKDNTVDNIMPLCRICHSLKTYLAGDKGTSKESKVVKKDDDTPSNDERPQDLSWLSDYGRILQNIDTLRKFIDNYLKKVINVIDNNFLIDQKMLDTYNVNNLKDYILIKEMPPLSDAQKVERLTMLANEKIKRAKEATKKEEEAKKLAEFEKRINAHKIDNTTLKKLDKTIKKIQTIEEWDEWKNNAENKKIRKYFVFKFSGVKNIVGVKEAMHKLLREIDIKLIDDAAINPAAAQP